MLVLSTGQASGDGAGASYLGGWWGLAPSWSAECRFHWRAAPATTSSLFRHQVHSTDRRKVGLDAAEVHRPPSQRRGRTGTTLDGSGDENNRQPRVPSGSTLRVEGRSLSIGGLAVLRDSSFEVPVDSIFALIGPNGAGKTSFSTAIARRISLREAGFSSLTMTSPGGRRTGGPATGWRAPFRISRSTAG